MKDTILCAVGELFQKYGIRSVSMDDIAHHLTISKKTIYQSFNDKNDLVAQIVTMIVAAKLSEYSQAASCASNALEELHITAGLIRKHFKELNPAFMYDLKKYHPSAWEIFAQHEKEVIYKAVVESLERGKKEGFVRPEINVQVIAKIRFEQIHSSFDESVFPKDEFHFPEVQMQLFDFFVHGVLTEEGLKQYKNYQFENNEQVNN
jgi:AcrR family transcriptional regulator